MTKIRETYRGLHARSAKLHEEAVQTFRPFSRSTQATA